MQQPKAPPTTLRLSEAKKNGFLFCLCELGEAHFQRRRE